MTQAARWRRRFLNVYRPMRSKVPSAAATWPWGGRAGRDQRLAFEGAAEGIDLSGGPIKIGEGALDDFVARRKDSRRSLAGGELRLGTMSMYMGDVDNKYRVIRTKLQIKHLHGYNKTQKPERKTIRDKSLEAKSPANFRGTSGKKGMLSPSSFLFGEPSPHPALTAKARRTHYSSLLR
jgi:hypothetical protein